MSRLHVHTASPVSEKWGGSNPVGEDVLDSRTARLIRLRNYDDRRGRVKELVDPRHNQRKRRQNSERHIAFLEISSVNKGKNA